MGTTGQLELCQLVQLHLAVSVCKYLVKIYKGTGLCGAAFINLVISKSPLTSLNS